MIDGVSAAGMTAGNQAARDSKRLNEDLNKFLTLLVTQLKHQDPLDPLDAHEFTAQLVQFASVEQQIHQNNHLENLLAAYRGAQSASSVAYLGTTVEASSDRFALQDGLARMTYALPETAAETSLVIRNDKGRVVFRTAGESAAGRHAFAWDGRDADGNRLADGTYGLEVVATRRDGSRLPTSSTVIGRIDATAFDGGSVSLFMGDLAIPATAVLQVKATPPADPQAAMLAH